MGAMKCLSCGLTLNIGVTSIEFEGDKSPDTETIAFQVLPMICSNEKCELYGGKDLSSPTQVVEKIRQRLN